MTPPCASRPTGQPFVWPLTFAFCAAISSAPAACSSDSDNHPAGLDSAGSSTNAGHSGTTFGGSSGESGNDGNASGGASEPGAAAGAAGAADSPVAQGDAGPGRPAPGPALCSKTAVWSNRTQVAAVSTAADEVLLSITSDELDLAFLRAGAVYVAHRASPTATFAVGAALVLPPGWSAAQGAALSADGKRLILLSTDQTMLGELTRASRAAVFVGAVDQSAFALVNQTSTFSGNIYASPALSPDDQELFLNSVSPGGASTVVASSRNVGEAWNAPDRVMAVLDGAAGARRLPTGVSADARTLFYFNEETMTEQARWREEPKPSSPLYDMVDLSTRRGAQPNAACDQLYSNVASDVIVERD